MKAKLVVVGGEAKAAEINLKLPTIIGRGREAPLMLPHPLVSRQHCEIFEQNGQLVVRDLGSLNGTFINNARITEAVLPNGELLTIGTVTFRAVYDDKGAAKPAGKTPSRPTQVGRGEKTVGQPSDPTIDIDASASSAGPVHPTVAAAPSKSKVNKAAAPPPAKPSAKPPIPKTPVASGSAVGKSGAGSQVGKSGTGSKVGKGSAESSVGKGKVAEPAMKAPFTAAQDKTLQVPAAAPPAVPPKKKAWAESKEDVEAVEFTDDDDFELGEDEDLAGAAPALEASEFTIQTAKPAGFGKRKQEEASDLNVEELDFNAAEPAPDKPVVPVRSNEKTNFPGSELTTNFDAKKMAEDEKARNKAKEDAKAKAAEEAKKKGGTPPKEEPKKGSLSTDEDLEAFFKSLG